MVISNYMTRKKQTFNNTRQWVEHAHLFVDLITNHHSETVAGCIYAMQSIVLNKGTNSSIIAHYHCIDQNWYENDQ